jgi:hypothetical protein
MSKSVSSLSAWMALKKLLLMFRASNFMTIAVLEIHYNKTIGKTNGGQFIVVLLPTLPKQQHIY